MSTPLAIIHSDFGRVILLHLDTPMACHAHRQCHVLLKVDPQQVHFEIRGQACPMDDEHALFINAWEPHAYPHPAGQAASTLLTCYFEPHWLREQEARLALAGHPRFFSQPRQPLSLASRLLRDELLHALMSPHPLSRDAINILMLNFFLSLTEAMPMPASLLPPGLNGELGFDPRIRQAISLMSENPGSPLATREIAQRVGLSRAHFFRLFNRSTGMAPATFSNMLKMEACLSTITRFDVPIHSIAEQLGYFPAGNFTRFFTHQQGLSPSHYRRTAFAPS